MGSRLFGPRLMIALAVLMLVATFPLRSSATPPPGLGGASPRSAGTVPARAVSAPTTIKVQGKVEPSKTTHAPVAPPALFLSGKPLLQRLGRGTERTEYARFPARSEITSALKHFQEAPVAARARQPMPLNEFFGKEVNGRYSKHFKVEFLTPKGGGKAPVAAVHATWEAGFEGATDNRFKDVHVFKLAESLGLKFNPFPEAVPVPNETGVLIRLWTDFRKMSEGVPLIAKIPGTKQHALVKPDIARIVIWSYVIGNYDGVLNPGNSGFAKFKDASGREQWRAVLVDAGGAFSGMNYQFEARPWHEDMNIAGTGPVRKENIPEDVRDGLKRLARAVDKELQQWSGLNPKANPQLSRDVLDFRERAQEVLEHYGLSWK